MTATATGSSAAGLLGATGFVGRALLRQTHFDACFNSRNVGDIEGRGFASVICAAAPGSMFEANTAPDRDQAAIRALIAQLSKVKAKRFVLISSIAVLSDFAGQHVEDTRDYQEALAYGRHRRELEAFVEDHFDNSLIVRLPALFGEGLRKNFLFDLLNPVPSMLTSEKLAALRDALGSELSTWAAKLYEIDGLTGMMKLDRERLNADARRGDLDAAVSELGMSAVQFHNRETTYQYYQIDRLWRDIGIASKAGLSHLHLASEPITAKAIHERLTGRDMPQTGARLHKEDMHSAHARLWDRTGPYLFDARETLDRLSSFFEAARVDTSRAAA